MISFEFKFFITHVRNFAKLITSQQLKFIKYSPTHDAKYKNCLLNVKQYIEQFGGEASYGWIFKHHKHFLSAEHHCVWLNNDILLDITPRSEDKTLYPLMYQNNHIFLPDDKADPIRIKNEVMLAPLPIQFYAIGDNQSLKEDV